MKLLAIFSILILSALCQASQGIDISCKKLNNHKIEATIDELKIEIRTDEYTGYKGVILEHERFTYLTTKNCQVESPVEMACTFRNNHTKILPIKSLTFRTLSHESDMERFFNDDYAPFSNDKSVEIDGTPMAYYIYSKLNDTKEADCIVYPL